MTTLYIDAFSGASGDMLLGALLDAGLPEAALREALGRLPVEGYEILVRREKRKGLMGTRAEVRLTEPHEDHDHAHAGGHHHHAPSRRLSDIEALIAGADLPAPAVAWASKVFRRLAEAEAKVHGSTVEEVHFHEVGAVDSIVDIVGVCAGLAILGVDRIVSSPLPMGSGYVNAAHGRLPVPAPAVVELMRDIPTRDCPETGELTTPTGAAILVTLAESFGPMPSMTVQAVGYGAGSREGERVPNLVRAVLGRAGEAAAAEEDSAWLLEANLDDATGETLGTATQAILGAGALDVWLVPATMKKGRPGVVLGCLADDASRAAIEDAIFRQTGTFGVRRTRVERSKLAREHVTVETPFGAVRVKVGRRSGRIVAAKPEYEDVLARATERGVAFREVYGEALKAVQSSKFKVQG